jgi:hypothetical protein
MTRETFESDSVKIANAINDMEAIATRRFGKGDAWTEYNFGNLREYFSDVSSAITGKK